jgi:polar amino acid transport system permease protein
MNQNQAERLQAERKKHENEFDITQYEHVPRRYYGRIFFATLIVIALVGLGRAFANGQIEWGYIGQFLTSEAILWGLLNTIIMSILAMLLGVVIGVIAAIMRMSANPILRYVAITYTWLFRGTPLILQLLLWFNLALIFPVIGIPGVFQLDTVSLMQYSELLHNAQNIYYANARVMELLIVAGIWYLAVVTVLSFGQSRLELRFARGAGKRS